MGLTRFESDQGSTISGGALGENDDLWPFSTRMGSSLYLFNRVLEKELVTQTCKHVGNLCVQR